jgi:hypothetical protein
MTSGGAGTCKPSFGVQVSGNNPNPSSFSLTDGGSQSVALGAGQFNVVETPTPGFTTSYSGDCNSTMAAGQQLTCTITNTAVQTTGTLSVNKVCVPPAGGGPSCQDSFNVQVSGNNPNPSTFSLTNGGIQSVALGSGTFTVTEGSTPGFTTSFSDGCIPSSSNPQEATGTIAAGQNLVCTITNTAAPVQTTGTLTVDKVCVTRTGGGGLCQDSFNVQVSGNNPNPSSFSLGGSSGSSSQIVALGAGQFSVVETPNSDFTPSFSGSCTQTASGSTQATGNIMAGQHLICHITNTAPPSGTLQINKVCLTSSGSQCNVSTPFTIQVSGNNPNPSSFTLVPQAPRNSQSVTLSPGSFTINESGFNTTDFTTSFSGDCSQTTSGTGLATGTIASGQHLTCTITNQEIPGTLLVTKVCSILCGPAPRFGIVVRDSETVGLSPPPVTLTEGASHSFTISPGDFTVEELQNGFTPSFSGDCTHFGSGGFAAGTIKGGQQLTCTITNRP